MVLWTLLMVPLALLAEAGAEAGGTPTADGVAQRYLVGLEGMT